MLGSLRFISYVFKYLIFKNKFGSNDSIFNQTFKLFSYIWLITHYMSNLYKDKDFQQNVKVFISKLE